jgi:hypothetical protein
MNEDKSIFDQVPDTHGAYVKFNVIGDRVEGTYINKTESNSPTYGWKQIEYHLKQKDGSVVIVAKKESHTKFHEQMSAIKFGQIVGVKYSVDLPSKTPGYAPTKILSIVARPDLVDQAWLDSQVPGGSPTPVASENVVAKTPETATASVKSQADKMKEIGELGKKLGAAEGSDIPALVAEKLNIPFSVENTDKILEGLARLVNEASGATPTVEEKKPDVPF